MTLRARCGNDGTAVTMPTAADAGSSRRARARPGTLPSNGTTANTATAHRPSLFGRNPDCSVRRPCTCSAGLALPAWRTDTYPIRRCVLRIEALSHSCPTGWYVVGSGAPGSWAVKERTEGGLKVVLCDAGTWPSPMTVPPTQPWAGLWGASRRRLWAIRLWCRALQVARSVAENLEANRWS
jgi:hypothetical protein